MTAYARYPSLQDRAVLITGGATGIGACLVQRFVEQGARVGFVDIDAAAGHALADTLGRTGAHAPVFAPVDLTDIAALRACFTRLREAIGPISALLNNAASDQRHDVAGVTPQSWDAGIAVNLRHQFFARRPCCPTCRPPAAAASSTSARSAGMLKQGGMAAYTTSKAAVQGLTRSLARDLGVHGIRVNTLVPGWVMTDKQLALWVDDAAKADIAKGQCIAKALVADDIARMALFLAADDSAMCTAQDFIVDGGWA